MTPPRESDIERLASIVGDEQAIMAYVGELSTRLADAEAELEALRANAPGPTRYVREGELVRSEWEYEYDDLELGRRDLKELVHEDLGPGREERIDRTRRRVYYGRVRLTIEPIA